LHPNKGQIIEEIEKVAKALAELNEEVAFVGGAVVGLYADDPGAADVRPTKDIDLIFEIATYLELGKLEDKLNKKGFKRNTEEEVICRFVLESTLVDVMTTKEVGWAPANEWFERGFKNLLEYELPQIKIKILPYEYFLASKFTAFEGRGGDPRFSHDFEDIVYLLDNRQNLVDEIRNSDSEVKKYLVDKFTDLVKTDWNEAIMLHLEPSTQTERFKSLIGKLKEIIK